VHPRSENSDYCYIHITSVPRNGSTLTHLLVGQRDGEGRRLEDDVDLRGGRDLAVLVVDAHRVLAGVFHRALGHRQCYHQLLGDLHSVRMQN